jgi:DNA repair exonuclease SbcCD ATPase subunit/DNA repair exonuclease SbcCD nuclease subunit
MSQMPKWTKSVEMIWPTFEHDFKQTNAEQTVAVFHIADIHIKAKNYDHIKFAWTHLLQTIKQTPQFQTTAMLVIAGDVFDHKTYLSANDISLFMQLMKDLEDANICTVIIPGNHDYNNNRSATTTTSKQDSSLNPFDDKILALLSTVHFNNIHYFPNSGIYPVRDLDFYIHSPIDGKAPRPDDTNSKRKTVAVVHEPLVETKTSGGFGTGGGARFCATDFQMFNMALFGDIHLTQRLSFNTVYPGAFIQNTRAESIAHGVVKWHVAKNCTPEFIPLPQLSSWIRIYVCDDQMPTSLPEPQEGRGVELFHLRCSDVFLLNCTKVFTTRFKKTRLDGCVDMARNEPKLLLTNSTTTALLQEVITESQIEDLFQAKILSLAHLNAAQRIRLSAIHKLLFQPSNSARGIDYRFRTMSWMNILCYKGKNHFNFQTLQNLNSLIGPNGVGKSSFLDIVLLILFNRLTHGNKNEILTHGHNHGYIKIVLDANDNADVYQIEHVWFPGGKEFLRLYKNGVNISCPTMRDTSALIEDTIVGSFHVFENTVLAEQERKLFVNIAPKERYAFFAQMIDLDKLKLAESTNLTAIIALRRNVKQASLLTNPSKLENQKQTECLLLKQVSEAIANRKELQARCAELEARKEVLMPVVFSAGAHDIVHIDFLQLQIQALEQTDFNLEQLESTRLLLANLKQEHETIESEMKLLPALSTSRISKPHDVNARIKCLETKLATMSNIQSESDVRAQLALKRQENRKVEERTQEYTVQQSKMRHLQEKMDKLQTKIKHCRTRQDIEKDLAATKTPPAFQPLHTSTNVVEDRLCFKIQLLAQLNECNEICAMVQEQHQLKLILKQRAQTISTAMECAMNPTHDDKLLLQELAQLEQLQKEHQVGLLEQQQHLLPMVERDRHLEQEIKELEEMWETMMNHKQLAAELADLKNAKECVEASEKHQACKNRLEDVCAKIANVSHAISQMEQTEKALSSYSSMVQRLDAAKTALHAQNEYEQIKSKFTATTTAKEAEVLKEATLEVQLKHQIVKTAEVRKQLQELQEMQTELSDRELYESIISHKTGIAHDRMRLHCSDLQNRCNELLTRLSDFQVEILFDEKIDIFICKNDNSRRNSAERASVYEKFLLDLVLRHVICSLASCGNPRILFIDEGFRSADQDNLHILCTKALPLLAKEFEKVLIVSHISTVHDFTTETCEITRTSDGLSNLQFGPELPDSHVLLTMVDHVELLRANNTEKKHRLEDASSSNSKRLKFDEDDEADECEFLFERKKTNVTPLAQDELIRQVSQDCWHCKACECMFKRASAKGHRASKRHADKARIFQDARAVVRLDV